jgi:hypothetical protein
MSRLRFVIFALVVTTSGCRGKQPIVVHVYRDRDSTVGRELDRRFYELGAQDLRLSSGRKVIIATVEAQDDKEMLRKRIGSEIQPQLIVLDSSADAAVNPLIERVVAGATNICAAVRACPAVVPAFIPSWVSDAQEL